MPANKLIEDSFKIGQLVVPKYSKVVAEKNIDTRVLSHCIKRGFIKQYELREYVEIEKVEQEDLSRKKHGVGLLIGKFTLIFDDKREAEFSVVLFGETVYTTQTNLLKTVKQKYE